MLKKFKKYSDKWFVKLLLGLIALSFGIWGIGDSIYQYITHRPLAKMGDKAISVEDFLHTFEQKKSQIQQQLGRSMTPQEQNNLKLHEETLKEITQRLGYELLLEDLGLIVDPAYAKAQIQKMNTFHQNGVFSQKIFEDLLNANRINPSSFLHQVSQDVINQQFQSIERGIHLPKSYKSFLMRAMQRQRHFRCALINFDAMKRAEHVDMKVLESFFEEKKNQYSLPSVRDIEVLIVDQESLLKNISISLDQVKKAYEDKISQFTIPEKRHVLKVKCPNMKQAHQILQSIQKTGSIKKSLKSFKKATFEDLGWMSEEKMSSDVASVVFSLAPDKKQTSGIIEQKGHFVIYQVVGVEKKKIKNFETVRLELETQLKQDVMSEKFEQLKATLDDELAVGKPLKEIEKAHDLRYVHLEKIGVDGADVKGVPLLEAYDEKIKKVILEQGFALEAGTDSGFQDVGILGNVLVQVAKIYPPTLPQFVDVKEKVRKDYESYHQEKEASSIAIKLMNIKNRSDFEEKIKKYSLIIAKDITLSRSDFYDKKKNFIQAQEDGLSQAFVKPIGVPTMIYTKDGMGVIMGIEDKPYEYKFDERSHQLMAALDKGLGEDLLQIVLKWCEKNYPIERNEKIWSKVQQSSSIN
jgi:peptidyl-prolyl cis-trans isomerase D